MTTDNSASAQVDAAFIDRASTEIEKFGNKGIIMAAPEVPLKARQKLLELGKQYGSFCVASFTTEEINHASDAGMMSIVDLSAINIDEASAITGSFVNKADTAFTVQSAIQKLQMNNKKIMISITSGEQGSWCWDGYKLNHFPAIKTEPISTAGAGDAFFSGIICGLALGLHLFEAQQLASLIAGLSVTSPNTIHKGTDRHSLYKFLHTSDITFSNKITKLLED